jgi:hypothetical protein
LAFEGQAISFESWRSALKPHPDHASGSIHPFRAFWETGDLGAWIDALEPDVELQSPVLTTPFRGREEAELTLSCHAWSSAANP